jgi:hypothetical protein
MVAVNAMAKPKKGPGRPRSDRGTTSVKVSADLVDKIGYIARAKKVSIPDLLDSYLEARVREEYIQIMKRELEKAENGE